MDNSNSNKSLYDKIVLTFNIIHHENIRYFNNKKYVKDVDNPYIFVSVKSVTSIGNSVFANCQSLTNIIIPESVTTIGVYTFYNCESLIHIVIPDTVTIIGEAIFVLCTALTTIETNNENAYIIEYCKRYYPNIEVVVTNEPYVLK